MIRFFRFMLIGIACLTLISCNKNVEDTSKLWEKSQASGDIITRSGTLMSTGSPEAKKIALEDAQNRLVTGGGLFGKGGIDLVNTDKSKEEKASYTSIGIPTNPYLWRGALETIAFMPLLSADLFAGIIITDWYTDENSPGERCKLNIFIKGAEMKTSNLKVSSFCQKLSNSGSWIDKKTNQTNNAKLENAILNKAKKIRLAQS